MFTLYSRAVKCVDPDVSLFTSLDVTGGKGLDGGTGFSYLGKKKKKARILEKNTTTQTYKSLSLEMKLQIF